MLHIIGIFISFFLALLIFTKKSRNQADFILGAWLIIIGLHLFAYYTNISGFALKNPFLINFNLPYQLLHGPFLYLYTKTLTSPMKVRKTIFLQHALIPFAAFIGYLPILFSSNEVKFKLIMGHGDDFQLFFQVFSIVLSVTGIFYVIITYLLLEKYRKTMLSQFSNQDKVNLNWLRFLFYGMTLIWVLIIVFQNDNFIFSGATIFVIFIGYFGIKQVGIFTNQNEFIQTTENSTIVEDVLEVFIPQKVKYAKSGLSEEVANQLHTELKRIMTVEKLFKEPELTLTDLANRLGIHPNYLSQVINEKEGVNFYDYVNSLRVEEFIKQIALPKNKKYTLLTVAYDAGFNSKSSFNRYFKKVTDLSPSEYLRNMAS